MASGSTPLKGETKTQYGQRMTAARKRNPKRIAGINAAASASISNW